MLPTCPLLHCLFFFTVVFFVSFSIIIIFLYILLLFLLHFQANVLYFLTFFSNEVIFFHIHLLFNIICYVIYLYLIQMLFYILLFDSGSISSTSFIWLILSSFPKGVRVLALVPLVMLSPLLLLCVLSPALALPPSHDLSSTSMAHESPSIDVPRFPALPPSFPPHPSQVRY